MPSFGHHIHVLQILLICSADLEKPVNRVRCVYQNALLLCQCCRCQPVDIYADVLSKLGWGAQDAAVKVCFQCLNPKRLSLLGGLSDLA